MPPLIGLFGGTFDPPHIGHLILAAEARAQLHLDRLLWVLTLHPPHKRDQPITSLVHRLAMLELALGDDPAFELSRIEIDRPGPHYAVDTVNLLTRLNPGVEFVYIMGGDSLHDLPAWHRPADLILACHWLGVMHRPGESIDLLALERQIPGLTAKTRFIEASLLDITSHDIRLRVAEGRPFRYYLPTAVYQYILMNNLYRND